MKTIRLTNTFDGSPVVIQLASVLSASVNPHNPDGYTLVCYDQYSVLVKETVEAIEKMLNESEG